MKLLEEPFSETYGWNYLPYLTDDFQELIKKAIERIQPFVKDDLVDDIYYFECEEIDLSEYDCCTETKCLEQTKKDIAESIGGIEFNPVYYANDGDHEQIEVCYNCGNPLNEWLTWGQMELERLEQFKEDWNADFFKRDAFFIHSLLQSMPTMDCNISEYSKHQKSLGNTEPIEKSLRYRQEYFERVKHLCDAILNCKSLTQ